MNERMRARADDTPEGAARQRDSCEAALELKDYEFNAHGVELGQRYRSGAVVSDGTPEPEYTRDPELYYHPTTWPGARLPHCWLGEDGHKVSTHDLVGKGRFALLTGISGRRWADAANGAAATLDIEIAAHVIGPGRRYIDLYDDWARLREVGEDGCVLVRPDAHVGWRSASMASDPERALEAALRAILDRDQGSTNSAGSLAKPAATAASWLGEPIRPSWSSASSASVAPRPGRSRTRHTAAWRRARRPASARRSRAASSLRGASGSSATRVTTPEPRCPPTPSNTRPV